MINETIITFIPQRDPFVLIDKLIKAADGISQTTFTVHEGHVLAEGGYLTESGLVENMAQTAAAGIGYKTHVAGSAVPLGYIAALKNLTIKELPKVGETITTEISYHGLIMNVHIVKGRVTIGEREIATCEFRIFEKKDQA